MGPRLSHGAAAAVVPPSNNGATTTLSVLNEENQSDIALQSLDGAASFSNVNQDHDLEDRSEHQQHQPSKAGATKKEKKD